MRTNLQIKVGSYTGNGSDNRNVTGVGFRPDFVLIKGGAQHSVFRTKNMLRDNAAYVAAATADLSNAIQEFLSDGFQVGTDSSVNGGAVIYHYLAIRASDSQNYFRTGRYMGNGADDRNFTTGGLNFTPDFVFTKRNAATNPVFRMSSMVGDLSNQPGTTAESANLIQSLISNGFQLGTDTMVNASGSLYNFFALKALAGVIAVGTYAGDGVDNRNITGVGFQPDFVLIKASTTIKRASVKFSTEVGEESAELPNVGVNATNYIQAFNADGFQVGTGDGVNSITGTPNYRWLAIKSGNFSVPVVRSAS